MSNKALSPELQDQLDKLTTLVSIDRSRNPSRFA